MNIPRFTGQSFSLDISTAWEGVNLYSRAGCECTVTRLKDTYVEVIARDYNKVIEGMKD
jgi:hypothetical protein